MIAVQKGGRQSVAPLGPQRESGCLLITTRAGEILWVPKTCATWADALKSAAGSVPHPTPGGPVLACRGVGQGPPAGRPSLAGPPQPMPGTRRYTTGPGSGACLSAPAAASRQSTRRKTARKPHPYQPRPGAPGGAADRGQPPVGGSAWHFLEPAPNLLYAARRIPGRRAERLATPSGFTLMGAPAIADSGPALTRITPARSPPQKVTASQSQHPATRSPRSWQSCARPPEYPSAWDLVPPAR